MPAQNVRSTIPSPAAEPVPFNGHYPKLLQGKSGSVWLVAAPNTGVIVHLSSAPQKSKHKLGYYTTRLVEAIMRPYTSTVTLAA